MMKTTLLNSSFALDQLGPDQLPVLRAQVLALDLPPRFTLQRGGEFGGALPKAVAHVSEVAKSGPAARGE